jgi:hypothetical protein
MTGESNVIVAAIANTHVPSIKIHIRIMHNRKRIDACRLLDSGAKGIFCNANFVRTHQFSQEPIESPIYPQNIDGTANKLGVIYHAAILQMEMGEDHMEEAHLLITDTGNHDVLLGTSWLKAHNPSIDWAKNTIKFDHCPQSCFKHEHPNMEDCNVSQLLPTFLPEPEEDNGLLDYIYDDIDTMQSVMHHVKKQYDKLFISRTTVSTHLAKAVEKPLPEIPLAFHKYS